MQNNVALKTPYGGHRVPKWEDTGLRMSPEMRKLHWSRFNSDHMTFSFVIALPPFFSCGPSNQTLMCAAHIPLLKDHPACQQCSIFVWEQAKVGRKKLKEEKAEN